jgi:glycerophosphoryl diester phosphodiesterase
MSKPHVSIIARIALAVFLLLSVFAFVQTQKTSGEDSMPALRLMSAARAHAEQHGGHKIPVYSPSDEILKSESSEEVKALQKQGFQVVVWTVDQKARMQELYAQGVDGIISDRPDLLRELMDQAVNEKKDRKLDTQGHRGGRDLRPENTLPAMEVALDNLMVTLETDTGVTSDGVSVLSHEPYVNPETCRRADGSRYDSFNKVLIKDLKSTEIQSAFICDKVFRGAPQSNDLSQSPVAAAFAQSQRLNSPYVLPTLQQLFDFVAFYAGYYRKGAGSATPNADRRAHAADMVRFNLETKIDPRYPARTVDAEAFTKTLANKIVENHMEERADIQSFDFRTLRFAQEKYLGIRTVYLVGDRGAFTRF